MSPKSQSTWEIPTKWLIIPGIPPKWTGDALQTILPILCSTFLCFGCWIFVYELFFGWPYVPLLPKYLRVVLSIVKYFNFAGAVFTFIWYLYDVFIYNPYYSRSSRRQSPVRSSQPQPRSTGQSGPEEPDWPMPELEPGHPLVELLKHLRELALATSYRKPLKRYGDELTPEHKRRRMSLREYADARFE